jgi:hypothetical protein
MSSDDQFTALGPATVGFQTHGANIERGAELTGTLVGASCSCNGRNGMALVAQTQADGSDTAIRAISNGTGVWVNSGTGNAVLAQNGSPSRAAVSAENLEGGGGVEATVVSAAAVYGFVRGNVIGQGVGGVGVVGYNEAVHGRGIDFFGPVGVLGASKNGNAGTFLGPVVVSGDFTVLGAKNAAVPHPDGTHRLLHCMESPECWFEDFGEAKLIDGEAKVRLDDGFASVVKLDMYHVFLTPHGDSHGLYVSHRSESQFEVREQGGGKSNISFSYRIAAKRRDIEGERLARITLPDFKHLLETGLVRRVLTGR